MKRYIMIVTALLITLLLPACDKKIGGKEKAAPERPVVSGLVTGTIRPVKVIDFYETIGTVKAEDTSVVSARMMGTVKAIHVKSGDPVKPGDLIIELDSPEIEAKLRAAREAREEALRGLKMAEKEKVLAEKTFSRYSALFDEKALSEQEFDQIKTKRDLAVLAYEIAKKRLKRVEAQVKEAESYRAFTQIKSPVSGIVAEKKIDRGSMAMPGVPLLIIEKRDYLVEASVNEELLGKVREGMKLSLEFPSLSLRTEGVVKEVIRQVDPSTRTFRIKIQPDQTPENLRGGLFSRISLPLGEKQILLIPESAVVKRGQLRGVYTVGKDGVLSLRYIKTGRIYPGGIEVLSGLEHGETVVVKGVDKAVDGGILKEGRAENADRRLLVAGAKTGVLPLSGFRQSSGLHSNGEVDCLPRSRPWMVCKNEQKFNAPVSAADVFSEYLTTPDMEREG